MSAAEQVPGGSPGVDGVLEQALAWLWRSAGFETARVLAYNPAVLIPVSTAASESLPWQHGGGRLPQRAGRGRRA